MSNLEWKVGNMRHLKLLFCLRKNNLNSKGPINEFLV
jgi:hypothetical protein